MPACQNCMGDGGWPSAVALQEGAANHHEVRRSRAGVLSVVGKGAPGAHQVRVEKASVSEPLMTCRKLQDDIETGVSECSGMSLGEFLHTAQMVSGIKAARARLRLPWGT
jgi:hypothetical protein